MSLECGFYNSINGDRKYDADDFNKLFGAFYNWGVMPNYGDVFRVTPTSGLTVSVGSGVAWLSETWSRNGSGYSITLDTAHATKPREDWICLKVDKDQAVRDNSFEVYSIVLENGQEMAPSEIRRNRAYVHPLAVVTVPAGAESLSSSNVRSLIGTGTYRSVSFTPYIQIANINTQSIVANFQQDFDAWFASIANILDENVAGHLQNEIDHIGDVLATNSKVVAIEVKDNLSIGHGVASQVTWSSTNVPTTDGAYKIVSRVPYQISVSNASSSGSGSSNCLVSSIIAGQCYVRNMAASGTAKVKVTCYFLYQKDYSSGQISG